MNPDAICSLVDGRLDAWHGLDAIERDRVPACLGPRGAESTRRFRFALLMADEHHPAAGGIARVFWAANGGKVQLVEIERDPATVARWVTALGAPESTHVYAASERRAAQMSCAAIEESIWGPRGLAVAIGRDASGAACAARVRGFVPSTPERYVDAWVRFTPEAL